MSVRNILLVLAAVLMTVGTGFLARGWLNSQRGQVVVAPAPEGPKAAAYVLVAETTIPAGTFLKKEHLRWQGWPDETLPDSYVVRLAAVPEEEAESEVIGAVMRRGISAGEPITRGRFIKPGDRGFLAAVLRPGYRAMAIRVDATSSIAGLMFPGDRVDVILTHEIKRGKTNRRAGETVLGNVRILAIDQTTNDQDAGPKVGQNATLELTAKQTEILAIVSDMGKLSLALRSLAKDEQELDQLVNSDEPLAEPDPERGSTYTWDSEASRLIWQPSSANQDTVQVARGQKSEELKFDKRN